MYRNSHSLWLKCLFPDSKTLQNAEQKFCPDYRTPYFCGLTIGYNQGEKMRLAFEDNSCSHCMPIIHRRFKNNDSPRGMESPRARRVGGFCRRRPGSCYVLCRIWKDKKRIDNKIDERETGRIAARKRLSRWALLTSALLRTLHEPCALHYWLIVSFVCTLHCIEQWNNLWRLLIGPVIGGCATLLHDAVMNPAEVVKQRMQMFQSPYRNCRDCILKVIVLCPLSRWLSFVLVSLGSVIDSLLLDIPWIHLVSRRSTILRVSARFTAVTPRLCRWTSRFKWRISSRTRKCRILRTAIVNTIPGHTWSQAAWLAAQLPPSPPPWTCAELCSTRSKVKVTKWWKDWLLLYMG